VCFSIFTIEIGSTYSNDRLTFHSITFTIHIVLGSYCLVSMKGNHLITEIIIASFGLVTELPKKDNLQGVGPNYIRDV